MSVAWSDPTGCPPVFIDFESQAPQTDEADLKKIGGRLYAAHPDSRVLSLVCLIDDVVHVWVPSTLFRQPPHGGGVGAMAIDWPLGHVRRDYITYVTPTLPTLIIDAVADGRLFVGHNVLGFDRFIWREKLRDTAGRPIPEPDWADTLLLARTAGLPGDLDKLSRAELDQGKDTGKTLLKKLMYRTEKTEYLDAHVGTLASVLRYNIADVLLLEQLWESFADLPVEADVIQVHDTINERGIAVDRGLLSKLSDVAAVSVAKAGDELARLTDGKLSVNNIRSTKQCHEWLNSHGVYLRDYEGKATLRKNIVEQALANPWMMLDPDAEITVEATNSIPPEVFNVLRLRAAALRITDAKAQRGIERCSADGRIRDLFTYWMAHTGRWSSSGVQIHNLPRAKRGIDVEALIRLHESGVWGADPQAAYHLLRRSIPDRCTVDDALSALIRPAFIPAPGHAFVIADFAAVEARCVAWLADETELLQAFAEGRDIYCEFASKLFGRFITKADEVERQVGKICILGLGYGMGAEKFRIFAGLSGIDLTRVGITAEDCVELYRGTYRRISGEQYSGSINGMTYRRGGLWDKLHWAMFDVVNGNKRVVEVAKCRLSFDGNRTMILTLPSSRQIRYPNARIEDRVPGYCKFKGINKMKATLVYDGPRGEAILYGAKAVENISQAVCRDLEAVAMVRVDESFPVVLHSHDEIGCEVENARVNDALDTLADAMTDPPEWAAGFPVAVEAFAAPRYYKRAPKEWAEKAVTGKAKILAKCH